MELVFGGLLALLTLWAHRHGRSPRYDQTPQHGATNLGSKINMADGAIQQWSPFVKIAAIAAAPDMHVDEAQLEAFAMAWLAAESGGKACAIGEPTATGPDGYPREVGLFQIYNPDDFKALGLSAADLCAYCARPAIGPRTKRDRDGGWRDGSGHNPQQLTHVMTPEQIGRHVGAGIGLIKLKRHYADHYLAASRVSWPTSSPDYWRMIKAVHAYPPLVNRAIAQVTVKLGRAPLSWAEYRKTYEQINPTAKFNPDLAALGRDQSPYYRGLENAEWVGGQVPMVPVS